MRISILRVVLLAVVVAWTLPPSAAAPPKLRLDLDGVLEGASDPNATYKVQFVYFEGTEGSISSPFSREAEVKDGRFRIRGIQPNKVYRVSVSKRVAGTKQMLAFPQGGDWSQAVKVGDGIGEPIRLTVVPRDAQAVVDGQQQAQLKFFYDGAAQIVLQAEKLTDSSNKL